MGFLQLWIRLEQQLEQEQQLELGRLVVLGNIIVALGMELQMISILNVER
jgi:hypothetical protein